MKSVHRNYLECDTGRPVQKEFKKIDESLKVTLENGTDPMSKVLKFPRGSLKETAPPPDSKRRVSRNMLNVHSLQFQCINFGLI